MSHCSLAFQVEQTSVDLKGVRLFPEHFAGGPGMIPFALFMVRSKMPQQLRHLGDVNCRDLSRANVLHLRLCPHYQDPYTPDLSMVHIEKKDRALGNSNGIKRAAVLSLPVCPPGSPPGWSAWWSSQHFAANLPSSSRYACQPYHSAGRTSLRP